MHIKFKIGIAVLTLFALLSPVASLRANAQNRHPAYVHALADLRIARAYIGHRAPNEVIADEEGRAIHEIDEAMAVIKRAALDDGKNPNERIEIDAHIQRRDRLTRAREALSTALHDAGMEEDDPRTKGLQRDAVDHIHRAWASLQDVMVREHLL